jgi:enoyl-CoA hydratase
VSLHGIQQPALLDEVRGNVLVLTLNRPDKLNALDQGLVDALHAAMDAYEHRAGVHAVVLVGAGGKAFAAGADIAQLRDRRAVDAIKGINSALFDRIAKFPCPVIAAVRGYALGGGCELALACDLRVAGQSAKFGQPETGLGIMAAAGATWRLAALIGLGRARELLFTGRIMEADEALHVGLVNQVVADDEVLDAAINIAQMISSNDPMATRMTKLALAQYEGDTAAMTRYANATQAALFENPEKFRRMDAFLARRKK